MTELKKVPVKVAAAILGKSEMFVRCGLRYGRLNFGSAVSSNPNKRHVTIFLPYQSETFYGVHGLYDGRYF